MIFKFEEDFELQEVRMYKDDEKEPRSIIKMKNGKSPFNFNTTEAKTTKPAIVPVNDGSVPAAVVDRLKAFLSAKPASDYKM